MSVSFKIALFNKLFHKTAYLPPQLKKKLFQNTTWMYSKCFLNLSPSLFYVRRMSTAFKRFPKDDYLL